MSTSVSTVEASSSSPTDHHQDHNSLKQQEEHPTSSPPDASTHTNNMSTSVDTEDQTTFSDTRLSVSGEASQLDVNLDFTPHQGDVSATTATTITTETSSNATNQVKEFFEKKDPVVFINERDVIKEYKMNVKCAANVRALDPTPILKTQTVEVGKDAQNHPIRRRADFKDYLVDGMIDKEGDAKQIYTAYDAFRLAAEKYPNRECLGVITEVTDSQTGKKSLGMKFETFSQVKEKTLDLGSALRNLGLAPHYHVGIYSKNRPEWQITSEACHTQSLVTIALYDTLGEESSVYIMNHGEVVALFVSGDDVFSKNVLKWVNQCEYLKFVILFKNHENPNYDQDVQKWKEEFKTKTKDSVKLFTFEEALQLGSGEKRVPPTPPRSVDIATIMYTSGTTGMPKGVMLTHLNIVSTVAGVHCNLMRINETDRVVSYLPLAHILERVAEMAFLQVGGSIGYWRGDVKKLKDDIGIIQPTLLPAVPRVLDRLYDGINDQIKQKKKIAQMIFNKAYSQKLKYMQQHGVEVKTPILDALVFKKVKQAVGGRLRGILSGGAPLRKEVQQFISVVFGCPVVQGYGLTETCAGSTIQIPYDFSTGHGGCLLPCLEIKLVDVPEMNYSNKDNNSGEICIRGPNISLGYYKEEEKTREVYDEDGWFHTGDIGRWNPTGTLSIVDRKKNIFKLAQGEYVAAENIEGKLSKANYVSRIWIYGDSYKTFLVGVVAVNGLKLLDWAITNGKVSHQGAVSAMSEQDQLQNLEKLCADPEINKMILKELERVGKECKLLGFEMVKAIKLIPRDFEFYPGCTTPKLSLVRNKLRDTFQKDIDEMYEKTKVN
ncbi:hypothetical protein C9374_009271 [Naegleria lovaniensis]|uniref:AMP-dependent synthetase/ligase domain-containing protein n=1 Tax=Naegleria lovaniensis TaxID=51637 RepID=A0AA88GID4_NAELO|nr:uncharacterized protein C9374_009271 [Naegleria lovaniensis]KAG2377360.1 hypothetical protein C9374_009271 [Naegleria lovaniensis]